MSYSSIAACTRDLAFNQRIESAIAQEQNVRNEPVGPWGILQQMIWTIATATDVEEAYEYALNAGTPDPGGDPTVITDGMILANVQANWPVPPAAEGVGVV